MSYFHRVNAESPTRVWVNNPSLSDARAAIADGAISCTTNPTYAAKQLAAEPDVTHALIAEAVRRESDDGEAAENIQRELCRRLLAVFLPLHDRDPLQGWVSLQGDPTREDAPDRIVESMLAARELAPNAIAKIPVTEAGLQAIELLAARGAPIIATEVMSISQALAAAAAWERATARSVSRPPLFITHITGILEEHLASAASRDGVAVTREELGQAAIAAAVRQYRLLRERGVQARMLGGGARSLRHFTGMVGLDMDVTINWNGTADRLIAEDPRVDRRGTALEPRDLVERLRRQMPDFRRAWDEQGLAVEEFREFGPVALFRDMFVQGWRTLLDAVAKHRAAASGQAARR